MAIDVASRFAEIQALDQLYPFVDTFDMMPGWNKPTPSLWSAPRKDFLPRHWRYDVAREALDCAGRLISTELAERRNLMLFNRVGENRYAGLRTVSTAYQMIMPGERARSHRHTPNALRLILDAEDDVYTVVDGQRILMEPGDVVLTPSWYWHGHGNDGGSNAYWIDFLDTPLIHLLEPMFFEEFPGGFERNYVDVETSPMAFRWRDLDARLNHEPTVRLDAPSMRTLGMWMHRLENGAVIAAHRTTANDVYAVAEGSGESTVDGQTFVWTRGDVFLVPKWTVQSHTSAGRATLLRVSDEPTLELLGFLRRETIDSP